MDSECVEGNGIISIIIDGGEVFYIVVWLYDDNVIGLSFENLVFGDYSVIVIDVNGCEDIVFIIIGLVEGLIIVWIIEVGVFCDDNNGVLFVFVSGGVLLYIYVWSYDDDFDGLIVFGLVLGDYILSVID